MSDSLFSHGTYVYTDGTKYIGEFMNNLRNGQGIYHFKDGSSYIGGWWMGLRDGLGIMLDKYERQTSIGTYLFDVLQHGSVPSLDQLDTLMRKALSMR